MARGAKILRFEVRLANVDRGVYGTLAIRAAQHPSESDEHLVTRVLAYCLEYADGIAFSGGGVSDPDEAPVSVRDRTGALKAWIDIGLPDAARLHKAAKAAQRVAVYTHRDPAQPLRALEGERIHRGEALEIYAFDRRLVGRLVERLDRRNAWDVSFAGGSLFVTAAGETLESELVPVKSGERR